MTVTGSDVLYPTNASKTITIGTAKVTYGGNDVTNCYNIISYYDETDGYTAEKGFKRADFKAKLSYIKRDLYYNLLKPDNAVFVYTGEEIGLTYNGAAIDINTENLITVDSTLGDGLLEGDTIVITKLSTLKSINVYTDWVKFKIYNEDGLDVTSCYTRTLANKEETKITVSKISLTFALDGVDKSTLLNDLNVSVGNTYFDASGYEGHKVLKEEYYNLVNGDLLDGQYAEVLAAEEGGELVLKVIIYEERDTDGKRKDKSGSYELENSTDFALTALYKFTEKSEA